MSYKLLLWGLTPLIVWNVATPILATKMIEAKLMSYEPWFPNKNIESDWKNIAYSNFIATQNSSYMANNNNINLQHQRNNIKLLANNGEWYSRGFQTIGQINWQNYAANKQSFIDNYQVKLNFHLSHNSWTNDWGWANPIHGSDGANLRFENHNFYSSIADNKVNKFKEFVEEGRKTHSQISFKMKWNGNNLELQTKLESKTWWNWGSWVEHAALISFKLSSIEIISQFSNNNFQYRLGQAFKQEFNLNTKTSPLINSEDKISVDGITKSNQEMISDEIEKRLKNSLTYNYWAWMQRLSLQKQYINQHNLVKLTFIDAQNRVPHQIKSLFQGLELKVKVNLLPQFWQKTLKERLEITPGKIVNPKKSTNELIADNPEFIKIGNKEIYVYHNSVKLTFSSTTNSGEVLFVNGQEVEVYNNIFNVELLDKGSKKDGDNTYEIVVKQKNTMKMQLTIKILTQASDTTFKWLGWNPENNPSKPNQYKQYKLITSTINGEDNPDYDPSINSKTGLRNQMIFVNKVSKYPFPLNPLDKFGRLIKDNKQDYMQGYIAEAMVVNSGIQNIFNDEELKNIDKIERVQVDPTTFEPLGNSEVVNVNNEMQFSLPGLWHYIYHIKDFVAQKVDPKATNYQSIFAKAGSTMHKFVLIGNEVKDYAEFLKQPQIFNNRDLEFFWSSIGGKHLKNFLKNERNIKFTQQINSLEYKEIIRYWKEYVSSAFKEQIDHKDEFEMFDLATLSLETLRINTNDQKVFLYEVEKHLKLALKTYVAEAQYEIDYYVTNELAQNINQIDWHNFLNVTENEKFKKIDLIVTSSNQSLFVKGKTKLTIINDLKYDVKKMLDLSSLKLQNFKYDFFGAVDEVKQSFKQNYLENYITNFLSKHRPKNVVDKYIYEIDYQIYVTFPNKQKMEIIDKEFDKNLQAFLNTEKYQTLLIDIVANSNSYLLKNQVSYEVTNDPSGTIAPIVPEIYNKDDDSLTTSLMWIIPIAIGGAILLTLSIFFVVKRFKRKIS